MKRIIPILLLAVMLLCACGSFLPDSPHSSAAPSPITDSDLQVAQSPDDSASAAGDVSVYDAYLSEGTYRDSLGNTWDFCLRIPAISAPGADAKRLNQELYNPSFPSIQDALNSMSANYSLVLCRVDYETYRNNDLLSIVATVSTDWGYDIYYTVNFDCGNCKEVSREELLTRFQLTQEQFLPLATDAVNRIFLEEFSDLPHDALWQDRHDKSLDPEHLQHDSKLYVDSDGHLCMIARLYSFAGADFYYRSIPIQ